MHLSVADSQAQLKKVLYESCCILPTCLFPLFSVLK